MLFTVQELTKAYATEPLFERITFGVVAGERIGFIGPNGAGKSTLLKVICGIEPADEGKVVCRQKLLIGYCSQSPEFPSLPLEELLTQGDSSLETRARILLSKAEFQDKTQNASTLSGGWKKRLDIVKALMAEPDLLLLDEPTNHLDIEGILWLEKFLLKERISCLTVSHDRYFLNRVATKVIELNRCYPSGIFVAEGDLTNFFKRKEAFLEAQAQAQQGLKTTVRDEIEWLRRGPKARTTKSRSRIQSANAKIRELEELKERNQIRKVALSFSATERETRKLLVAKNLTKSLGGKLLFKGLDITLSPGTRLGIVGKNGTGKTTLLKILAQEVVQDQGTVKYADGVQLAYFDQHRETLPFDSSLRDALSPNGEYVTYQGQPVHVNGWAKKFLFAPERLSLPVRCLSGGERARILIAKLLLKPADILFLDEPTNDLDIQTLEVIEESLQEFPGALVLISHDRCLMDRVCTSILAVGSTLPDPYFADYSQWEKLSFQNPAKKEEQAKPVSDPVQVKPKKLSYKEQKELEGMEEAILLQEQEIKMLEEAMQQEVSSEHCRRLADAQRKLDQLFERWQLLSAF